MRLTCLFKSHGFSMFSIITNSQLLFLYTLKKITTTQNINNEEKETLQSLYLNF